jgi:DNA ligase-1
MHSVFDILQKLESTPGKNDKLAILQANKENEDLKKVLKYAIDPYIKFHIAKMPEVEYKPLSSDLKTLISLDVFWALCDRLASREVTGHTGRDQVASFLSNCDPESRDWYERILMKNLRVGVDTSPDKVWPGLIASFKVQRAESYNPNVPKTRTKLDNLLAKGGVYSSPKMDGMRAVNREAELLSRGGHEIPTVPHIAEALGSVREKYVMDGELWFPGDTKFEDFISIVKRSDVHVDSTKVVFNIFDIMYKSEWDAQKCTRPFEERLAMLQEVVGELAHPSLLVVEHVLLKTYEEVMAKYEEYLALGFEGSMVKDRYGNYVFKKSWDWVKIKPEDDEEFKCIGIQEGRPGTGWTDMVGAVILEGPNGQTFDCGSGLSKAKRKEFWNDPTKVIGKLVTVKFQEKNKSGIPRFGIFKTVRDYE